jgi:hypothetical protein
MVVAGRRFPNSERHARVTETACALSDILFVYLANETAKSSRSAEHYPMRRHPCIRPDTVSEYSCFIVRNRKSWRRLNRRSSNWMDLF